MKKLLVSVLVASSLIVTVGSAMPAKAASNLVKITGVVSFQNQPVAGIRVLVECWQTGFSTRPITNPSGLYSVNVTDTECPFGSQLKVRAETNDKVAFRFGVVQSLTVIDLKMVSKVPVPEYDSILGMAAIGLGAGVVLIARRQKIASGL